MKLGKIIWLVVLFCCIGLGVWQIHNISIFWREYRSLWRDYDYREYALVSRRHIIIPEDVARSDPEAAAIAETELCRYERDEYLTTLSENTLKFPNSEYLLYLNARVVLGCSGLDQKISVKLTEKLINLDRNNSLYHYLKAMAILADRQGDNITPTLDEIKTAANCPDFYFPEVKYAKRVAAIAEKASVRPVLVGELSNPYLGVIGLYDTHEALLRYAHRAFTDGETERGLLIDDAINSIGKNQFDAGHNEARLLMNCKDHYLSLTFGFWLCPEMLELQRAKISEQRAGQNRLQLCPYALQQIKNEKRTGRADLDFYRKPEVTDEQMIFAVSSAMYNGRMLFATAIVLLALIAISKVRGWPSNQKIGITTFLLFAATSLYYFIVMPLFALIISPEICCCYSYVDIMRPMSFDWKQITEWPPIYWFVPLICPVLATLLLWSASRPRLNRASFWLKIPLRLILAIVISEVTATLYVLLVYLSKESIDLPKCSHVFVFVSIFALPAALFASWLSKLRLVKAVLVTTPLGIFTTLASPYAYICWIPFILFVVMCMLIVLNKPSDSIPFRKILTGIFSRQPELAAIRSRAVKLIAPFIVIYWLLFVASIPTYVKYITQVYSWSYSKLDLAPADETSYRQALAKFYSDDFTPFEFLRLIPLIMPQDLPSVLNTCKDRCISTSYPYRFLKNPAECSNGNSTPEQDKLIKKFNDYYIITAMQGCGRDVINILADAMDNPERESVLVSRAKLGDVRVKAKLEELLALRLTNGEPPEPNEHLRRWDRPMKTIDIIYGLACISEPNEAGARFMDYVARSDISQLAKNDKFFEGIRLLQTTQARAVIKAYLTKAQNLQPAKKITFSPAREVIGTYDDRDIAEAVLKIMLRSEDDHTINFWNDPWKAPQDFDIQSADLLRQGLASKNEQLRAWCVWRLRKVGYQFSEEEEARLLADESWKVRANAVIAGGGKTAERAAEDPNPFVRWVVSLSTGKEN